MTKKLISWDDVTQSLPAVVEADLNATFGRLGDATADRDLGTSLSKVGVVLGIGTGGAFDESIVEGPTILLDPNTGRNVMVYVGYNLTPRGTIGYAYSNDLITWTKQGQLLAQSGTGGAPDQNGCTGPLLLWDVAGEQYVLYYIGLTATGYEGGTKTICYATATTLTGTWTRHGAVITEAGSGWRADAVWHPSIVQRGGTWFMFFNATGTGGAETIGYATAPAITGPWTVDDANSPLVDVTAAAWDSLIVGDPSVRRVGDLWVMDYYGYNGSAASDGIAVTTDADFPLGWAKHPANPVLTSSSGTYDSYFAHKPFTFQRGGTVFHYYTCVNAANLRQIALAVSAQAAPPPLGRLAAITGKVSDGSALRSLLYTLQTFGLPLNLGVVVASDDFTRADSGTLGSTPVGAKAWTKSGATDWAITGNQAAWTGATDGRMVINSGVSDNYAVQFTVRQVSGAYPITMFVRGDSSSNSMAIYRDQGANTWVLKDATGHAGSTTGDVVVGDVLRCEVIGNTFTFYVNGVQVDIWTGYTFAAGGTWQGIGGNGTFATAVDDFSVASI